MKHIGLVLEGGGMRGLYTSGVLDFFMEKDLYFPYVIGVSAGACNAASYLSKQIGRSRNININYANDPRYLSYTNLVKHGSLFGMDFLFDEIPNKLVPFDCETYNKSKQRFIIVTTDCTTGKVVYFDKDNCEDILPILKASSSLPFVSPIVEYKGMKLLDGGIADPIPIRKSIDDGNTKNVVVLTRNKGYRKKPFKLKWLARRVYSKYDKLVEALVNRYKLYNQTLEYIGKLEKEGSIFVIRPSQPLDINRIERNPEKLEGLYKMGYEDAKKLYYKMEKWLG